MRYHHSKRLYLSPVEIMTCSQRSLTAEKILIKYRFVHIVFVKHSVFGTSQPEGCCTPILRTAVNPAVVLDSPVPRKKISKDWKNVWCICSVSKKQGKKENLRRIPIKRKLANVADAYWLTNPPHFTATNPIENYKQIHQQLQETNPRKYKNKTGKCGRCALADRFEQTEQQHRCTPRIRSCWSLIPVRSSWSCWWSSKRSWSSPPAG